MTSTNSHPQIVNNKRTGADVDKWDYFLRDCHGLGINVSGVAGGDGPTKCLAGGGLAGAEPGGTLDPACLGRPIRVPLRRFQSLPLGLGICFGFRFPFH